MLLAGARVDRWEVEAVVGRGGMAVVYAVRHVVLGTRHALKVLSVHNAALAERMLREGRLQGAIRHPNVVAVTDFVDVAGAPGLVLELVDGPSLEEFLARGRPAMDVIDRIGRGLLSGLEAAHRHGLVHRDLKPANVLLAVGDDGLVPKITDFGLVKALGEDLAGVTRPGALLGTPGYMAPEQLRAASDVDARADLFSLGALLYELVTGRPAFVGPDPIALYHRMCARGYTPVRDLVADVPADMEAAIAAALEPDPERRVADAASLRALWTGQLAWEPPPRASGAAVSTAAATWALEAPSPSSLGVPRYGRAFVGRQRELSELNAAVERPGLVTIVGTGGVGKTRIASELAERWADAGRRVVWVDLQEAQDETDLSRRVAWALDLRDDSRPDAVARALAGFGEALVVLDNVEQLLVDDAVTATLLGGWVDAARHVRLLLTSRLAVGLRGERVLRLEPLQVPSSDDALRGSDVYELFVSASPADRLDADGLGAVRDVLRMLDGLPLAIELAAARLEVLGLGELRERLAEGLPVLASPGDTSRHGALERTIAWSWDLLGARERAALAQAAVFRGGFTLAAAEAVLRVEGSVLDALHGLVRRSLLVRDRSRFRLLEAIRAFAASRLEDRGALARHAAFYGGAARGWCDRRVTVSRCVDEAAPEAANLEAVVGRAGQDAALVADALWCGCAVVVMCDVRGPIESRIPLADAILALPGGPERPRVEVQRLRARWRRRRGDVEGARADLDEATRLARAHGHADLLARLAANLGDLHMQVGEDAASWAAYEEALAGADAMGLDGVAAVSLGSMCILARELGRTAQEQDALGELAIRRAERLGDAAIELQVYKSVGTALLERKAFPSAAARLERGIALAEQLGDGRSAAVMTGQVGLMAEARADLDRAEDCFRRVIDAMRAEGDPNFLAYYEGFLGRVLLQRGRWEEGVRRLEAALAGLGPASDPTFLGLFGFLVALARAREGDVAAVEAWVALDPQRRSCDPAVAVPLARAVAAWRAGDRAAASEAAAEAAARLEADVVNEAVVTRLLTSMLAELRASFDAWRFAADGGSFVAPGGAGGDVSRHTANMRILAHLVAQRVEAPGEASDVEALAGAGWPGERIVPSAAANRVRVALSALRRAGLEPVLRRDRRGWLLDPDVPIEVGAAAAR